MNLYEEYKLYETLWEEQETGPKAMVYIKDLKKKKAICDKLSSGYKKVHIVTDISSFLRNSISAKDGVEFYADTEGMKELKDALADKPDKQSAAILKATKIIKESTEKKDALNEEATDLESKQISMAEAPAAKYEILYSDRHTEIVDEDTMNQLVDELEAFTRYDVSQIYRIYNNGKLGKTIWTEEEGLL